MKITPIDIIKDMSGKICQHSDTYISLNTSSGKMFTGKRCHPYTGPLSEKQLAQQQAFKARAEKATAWLLANRPSATNGPQGTAAYQVAQRLKKQLALSNVRQVVAKYMDESGEVKLPSANVNENNGGSTPSGGSTPTPSGGGSTSGGNSGSTSSGEGGID